MERRDKAVWASSNLLEAPEDRTNGSLPPPSSGNCRPRLLRECTDARTRDEDEAGRSAILLGEWNLMPQAAQVAELGAEYHRHADTNARARSEHKLLGRAGRS